MYINNDIPTVAVEDNFNATKCLELHDKEGWYFDVRASNKNIINSEVRKI